MSAAQKRACKAAQEPESCIQQRRYDQTEASANAPSKSMCVANKQKKKCLEKRPKEKNIRGTIGETPYVRQLKQNQSSDSFIAQHWSAVREGGGGLTLHEILHHPHHNTRSATMPPWQTVRKHRLQSCLFPSHRNLH